MNKEPQLLIKATAMLYYDCCVMAARGLAQNWIVLLASVMAFICFQLSAAIFLNFGMAGGLLLGLVQIAFLSLYYSWLGEIIRNRRIKPKGLLDFDMGLFFGLIGIGFILWIVEGLIGSFLLSLDMAWAQAFLRLTIILVFNAIPEVLYIHRYESLAAMREAFRFTLENWIEWYLPFIVIIAPLLLARPEAVPLQLASAYPLLPVSLVYIAPANLLPSDWSMLAAICGVVVANWFMVFRGFLFLGLESGSRRKRMFEAKNR